MADLRAQLKKRPFLFALALSVALLIANVLVSPVFGKPSNWATELAAFAPIALVAIASTPSILAVRGGIDISIGPLMIFCNVMLVAVLLPHGIGSAWVDVPLLLALGAAVGAINGVLVGVLRFPPIIATLCMFFILGGLSLQLGSSPDVTKHNWTSPLAGSVGPIPCALLLLAFPAVIWLALSTTPYLRKLYAAGGNDVSAYSAGVNVRAVIVGAYALGGLFAAVGGIALTAFVQSSQGPDSSEYILIAVSAVALGGTNFAGGEGGLFGSLCGAASIYLIQTFLGASGVGPNWLDVVYGAMLLAGIIVGATLTTVPTRRVRA
jgi:ribose transport system permease protein